MIIGLEILHTWLASSNTISYPLVLTIFPQIKYNHNKEYKQTNIFIKKPTKTKQTKKENILLLLFGPDKA